MNWTETEKNLQPLNEELHGLLHELEQCKVRVKHLIKKLQCKELKASYANKCEWTICRCGEWKP